MASVTLYFNRKKLGEVELKRAKCRVGRHPAADVFLPHQSVSRLHALLIKDREHWELHDPGGTNGLFVNGSRVRDRRQLENGDRIQLSMYTLIFDTGELDPMAIIAQLERDALEEQASPNFVPKADGTERFDRTQELSMVQATLQHKKARMREHAHLQWTSANGARAFVPIGAEPVTIGSADFCRITIPSGFFVGKLHAVIARDRGRHELRRPSWWRLTRLNGKWAPSVAPLQDGDRIDIGNERIQFFDELFQDD